MINFLYFLIYYILRFCTFFNLITVNLTESSKKKFIRKVGGDILTAEDK